MIISSKCSCGNSEVKYPSLEGRRLSLGAPRGNRLFDSSTADIDGSIQKRNAAFLKRAHATGHPAEEHLIRFSLQSLLARGLSESDRAGSQQEQKDQGYRECRIEPGIVEDDEIDESEDDSAKTNQVRG
jgi:hypothetical protein